MIAFANAVIFAISSILQFLALTWWLYPPIILIPVVHSTWLFWRQQKFKSEINWVLHEFRMPRETTKSPRAMEQVLAAWHSLRNAPGDLKEWYIDGEVTKWFSLEIVSFGGEVRFFIRHDKKQTNLIQAPMYAYYPDVEIVPAKDYAEDIPLTIAELEKEGKDMYGVEMNLSKSPAYPIKSYADFEKDAEDEKKFDPISTFLEVLGKLDRDQFVAIQMLIEPMSPSWKKEYEPIVDQLRVATTQSKPAKAKKKAKTVWSFEAGILPVLSVESSEGDSGAEQRLFMMRSPGETDTLKAVEDNLSQPAFSTLIRFIYISPKETYYDSFPRRGLVGAFNQYASLSLNSFVKNQPTETRTQIWNWPHIFPKVRARYKKQRMLFNYKNRETPEGTAAGKILTSYLYNFSTASKMFPLSCQSLATLFHPPTATVLVAPHIKRIESRKAGPPAGLAIFGEGEKDLEKFQ